MIWLFWLSAFLVGYALFGYGLVLWALSFVVPRRRVQPPSSPLLASFIIPGHNEEASIAAKIENSLSLEKGEHDLELIVVSDGSDDQTVAIARGFESDKVRVLETEGHVGKAAAMNMALQSARGDILVFSDANSILTPGSFQALMQHFGDSKVGGVCGRISVPKKKSGWIGKAERLFWQYDQSMKQGESDLGGVVSAQGSIYAMRRSLVPSVPEGVTDDFAISVQAVHQGQRLVFEPDASTEELVTDKTKKEFNRRVRSTLRGWRGLMMNASLMNPFKHGLYSWQLISHKLLRRLNPLFLLILLLSNLALAVQPGDWSLFWQATFAAQLLFYVIGFAAIKWNGARKLPGASVAAFFILGHLAMALGIVRYYLGYEVKRWKPVRENSAP